MKPGALLNVAGEIAECLIQVKRLKLLKHQV